MRNKAWAGWIDQVRYKLGQQQSSGYDPGANVMYVSNLNPAGIYNYSSGSATANGVVPYSTVDNYPATSTPNQNTSTIFRSKNYNVIFIGEGDFANQSTIDTGSGYYSFLSGQQGYYTGVPSYNAGNNNNLNADVNNFAPMTVSNINGTGFAAENAKIMGNMVVWGLIEGAYRGANNP